MSPETTPPPTHRRRVTVVKVRKRRRRSGSGRRPGSLSTLNALSNQTDLRFAPLLLLLVLAVPVLFAGTIFQLMKGPDEGRILHLEEEKLPPKDKERWEEAQAYRYPDNPR